MRNPIIILLVIAAPVAAHAQVVFPADSAYRPLRCGNMPMTDGLADTAGFLDDLDVVGDPAAAAGLRASDATNLYLRIRLEADPVSGTLQASTWGMEFNLDIDTTNYELLVLVDGIAAPPVVSIFTNTMTTLSNDPNDPADMPAVQSYPFGMNGRSVAASGSNFGGDGDFFLDFAVPWSELVPLGLDRDTSTRAWVASSASQNSLNGDFACHDPANGAVSLGNSVSDTTTGDPNEDTTGGTGRLEGGGGCAVSGNAGLLVLALFGLLRKRRAR
ncbi:MAG TPA: hypothetical protein VIV11_12300 [Kofleriaceae bacterium]